MIKAIICDIRDVLISPEKENQVNEKLINFLITNKEKYGMLLLYSNSGEKSIERFMSLMPNLHKIVDKGYYSYNFEYLKPDIRGFEKILNDWDLKPQEVIFIDDNDFNIGVAKSIGIETILYKNFKDIVTLNSLLSL